MKGLTASILFALLAFSCQPRESSTPKMNENTPNTPFSTEIPHITNWQQVQAHKGDTVIVEGHLQPYTPNTSGKGAGHMFWDWEVVLKDTIAIPVIAMDGTLDPKPWNGKQVMIHAVLYYGIVIGSPDGQNATGWRVDALAIKAN